jgi:hypothetical protein
MTQNYLTQKSIVEIAGELSDSQVTRIVDCHAQEKDLLEALAWLNADDAVACEIHHEPTSVVAQLCEILAEDQPPEEEAAGRPA